MTRVIHVTWRLSTGGGVPVVIRNLLQRLPREEFDQHVVTVRPDLPEDCLAEVAGHATIHPLGVVDPRSMRGRPAIALQVRRALQRLQPDIVHTHSGTAWYTLPWILSTRRRPRRLLEVHDAPRRGRHGRTSEWLEGLLMRRLGYVPLVHSTSVRDDVVRVNRVPRGAVRWIPLGIETGRFVKPPSDPARWRARVGIRQNAPLVSYMARLVPTKNIPLFVEVASRVLRDHPEAVFAVVAGGAREAALRSHIAERRLSDHVLLVGAQYGEDLVAAYHATDVFLATSDYEGFGLAIVEAMTAGLPVVATGVGGVRDLLEHGESGFLTKQGDAAALAGHVSVLLGDPALRRSIGKAAQDRALGRFDVQHLADGVADLYRSLAPRA